MDEWLCLPRNRAGSRVVTVLIAIRQGQGGRTQGGGEGEVRVFQSPFFSVGGEFTVAVAAVAEVTGGGGGCACVPVRRASGAGLRRALRILSRPSLSDFRVCVADAANVMVSRVPGRELQAPSPHAPGEPGTLPSPGSEPLSQFSHSSPLPSPFTPSSPAPALPWAVVLATPCSPLAPSLLCS